MIPSVFAFSLEVRWPLWGWLWFYNWTHHYLYPSPRHQKSLLSGKIFVVRDKDSLYRNLCRWGQVVSNSVCTAMHTDDGPQPGVPYRIFLPYLPWFPCHFYLVVIKQQHRTLSEIFVVQEKSSLSSSKYFQKCVNLLNSNHLFKRVVYFPKFLSARYQIVSGLWVIHRRLLFRGSDYIGFIKPNFFVNIIIEQTSILNRFMCMINVINIKTWCFKFEHI